MKASLDVLEEVSRAITAGLSEGMYLKIALVSPDYFEPSGGIGTYCLQMASYLAGRVDELHVFVKAGCPSGMQNYHRPIALDHQNGLVLHEVDVPAGDPFITTTHFQRRLAKCLPRHEFDIVHSLSHMLRLGKDREAVKVGTVHSTVDQQRSAIDQAAVPFWDLGQGEKWQVILHPVLHWWEDLALSGYDHILTVSNWMRSRIEPRIRPGSLSVLMNGVDSARFVPSRKGNHEGDRVVLFVGRLTWSKGIMVLLRSIPLVLERFQDANFILAGPGDQIFLSRIANRIGIPGNRISFTGLVEWKQMPQLYMDSDIFVLPSFTENMPFALLEAMSTALPVVATPVGAIPEVVASGKNSLFTEIGDSNGLAEAICLLLSDRKLSSKIGLAARKTVVDRFDYLPISKRLLEIYRSLHQS